jgi:hypothetical protein
MSLKKQNEIRTREITETDFDAVAEFLSNGIGYAYEHFFNLLQCMVQHPTPAGFPKYGRLLESDGVIVGAIILIHSTIWSDGIPTIRCHVCGWCVEPAYRSHAVLFFAKDLKHSNITYLNISAKGHVLPIIDVQGFARYSSGQFVAFSALQFASGDNQAKVIGVDDTSTAPLVPFERDLLLAHAKYGCLCCWCVTPGRAYPFVFRPRFFKGFVPGVQLVYCSDIEHFVRFVGPIARFLAWRGKLMVRIDANGAIPGLIGKFQEGRDCRYYKGSKPRLGDLAYSHLAMCGPGKPIKSQLDGPSALPRPGCGTSLVQRGRPRDTLNIEGAEGQVPSPLEPGPRAA